ncbi:MAG: hypothetical protein JWR55_2830 [Aeromicrobium sp.]|nr:hypothetical protein [Aeromicrobium sp.]
MFRRYAVLGACLTAISFLVPSDDLQNDVYLVIGLSCVAAIIVGVVVNRPAARLPWLLMAVAQALWLAGDAMHDSWATTGVAMWSDALYLTAYPLAALGLADLIRHRRGGDPGSLIDTAIVTLALGLVSWVFIADPILDDTSRSVAARAIAVAYPAGDIVMLGMLVVLLTVPGTHSATYRLLTVSMLLLVAGDSLIVAAPQLHALLHLVYALSYVGWGLAALHPTMTDMARAPHARRASFTVRRLAALAAALLIAPALVWIQVMHGTHVDTWIVVLGASLISLLVVARMALNIDELRATARQRDELQNRLLHEASHDPLTGAANAAAMRQLIGSALRRGRRSGTATTIMLVELDGFDDVVDRHGPARGDEVLRETATRLRSLTADPEQVGRLDGSRFVMLLDPSPGDGDLAAFAEHVLRAVAEPVAGVTHHIEVTACVGATTAMDGGTDADELRAQAHAALRRAQATARSTFEVFGEGLRREVMQRRDIEAALHRAIDDGDLALRYEPLVALQGETLHGYEARIHWWRPGEGWQDPRLFLAVAGDTDLVCDLDRWAIGTALEHLAIWTSRDPAKFSGLTMAVPVSGRTLISPGFAGSVATLLDEHGIDPGRLTVTVTETTLVDLPSAAVDLTALRDRGVRVRISEFGTGHSAIGRLASLPADMVTIDRTLVDSVAPGALELLALLVHATRQCGLLVVTSGDVEDSDPSRRTPRESVHGPVTEAALHDGPAAGRANERPRLFVVPDPSDS